MTNEEAIDYNKNLRMYMRLSDKNQPCKFLEENYIALDMAIKALEQGDVLDKIKGYIDHIRNTGMGKKKSLEFIEKFIEGLKSESEVSE